MHASPPETRRPLLALVTGFVLLCLLGASSLLVASSRRGGETQSLSQASPVPSSTWTLSRPLTPAETCERAVVQALTRYAVAVRSGQNPDLAMGAEMQSLEPLASEAILTVAYSFQIALSEPAAQSEGLDATVKRVQPGIRRVCQRAG
ncbi:hypothetical protein [Actinomadura monticuli]|uniref:Uncharacterized protein n=1 Tax=Actinomadura monticuli TaxID=3097367 RepID=A0ABV4Q9D1_9ACTN